MTWLTGLWLDEIMLFLVWSVHWNFFQIILLIHFVLEKGRESKLELICCELRSNVHWTKKFHKLVIEIKVTKWLTVWEQREVEHNDKPNLTPKTTAQRGESNWDIYWRSFQTMLRAVSSHARCFCFVLQTCWTRFSELWCRGIIFI